VNPDTEQVGYHAQSVTKEQVARAEALVRRMCPDPDPVLQALGLQDPPPPAPADGEYCKNGHLRTEANTGWRRKTGRTPHRWCRDCAKERYKYSTWNPDTHCRNGHPRTPENTATRWNGDYEVRSCKDCEKTRKRGYRQAGKGAQ
jgi:hypothetical protein